MTYLTEVLQISLVTSLLEGRPGLLRKLVRDIVQIEFAILGALDGLVAWRSLLSETFVYLRKAMHIPSDWQFLHTSGGLSGHSAAG